MPTFNIQSLKQERAALLSELEAFEMKVSQRKGGREFKYERPYRMDLGKKINSLNDEIEWRENRYFAEEQCYIPCWGVMSVVSCLGRDSIHDVEGDW